jgi:hypothetical protein
MRKIVAKSAARAVFWKKFIKFLSPYGYKKIYKIG